MFDARDFEVKRAPGQVLPFRTEVPREAVKVARQEPAEPATVYQITPRKRPARHYEDLFVPTDPDEVQEVIAKCVKGKAGRQPPPLVLPVFDPPQIDLKAFVKRVREAQARNDSDKPRGATSHDKPAAAPGAGPGPEKPRRKRTTPKKP